MNVATGTQVTLLVSASSPVSLSGKTIIINDESTNQQVTMCSVSPDPNNYNYEFCSATVGYDSPQTHVYIAEILDATYVQLEDTPVLQITWGGGGTTSCGTTRGQHCTAIWTDKSQYQVGDTITWCYSVPQPSFVRVIDVDAGGNSQVVVNGNDDGTGDCGQAQITPPTGTEQLLLTVYDSNQNLIGKAQTSFQVLPAPVTPTPVKVVPGGLWISPDSGQQVTQVVHFAAHAYPTNAGDPPIDHVSFTASLPGTGSWLVLCRVTSPTQGDVYQCDADLSRYGSAAGPVQISFDVYDQAGNYNLAPNGERTIYYSPPATPTNTATPTQIPTSTPTPTATPTRTPPFVPRAVTLSTTLQDVQDQQYPPIDYVMHLPTISSPTIHTLNGSCKVQVGGSMEFTAPNGSSYAFPVQIAAEFQQQSGSHGLYRFSARPQAGNAPTFSMGLGANVKVTVRLSACGHSFDVSQDLGAGFGYVAHDAAPLSGQSVVISPTYNTLCSPGVVLDLISKISKFLKRIGAQIDIRFEDFCPALKLYGAPINASAGSTVFDNGPVHGISFTGNVDPAVSGGSSSSSTPVELTAFGYKPGMGIHWKPRVIVRVLSVTVYNKVLKGVDRQLLTLGAIGSPDPLNFSVPTP